MEDVAESGEGKKEVEEKGKTEAALFIAPAVENYSRPLTEAEIVQVKQVQALLNGGIQEECVSRGCVISLATALLNIATGV